MNVCMYVHDRTGRSSQRVRCFLPIYFYQDSLKKCRYVHDRDNQMLENNLDLVLDQLRQGSSEEVHT